MLAAHACALLAGTPWSRQQMHSRSFWTEGEELPSFMQARLCWMLDACMTGCTCACLCYVCAHAQVCASMYGKRSEAWLGCRDPVPAFLYVLSVYASAARANPVKVLAWWSAMPCIKLLRGAQCGGQGAASSVPAARRPLVTSAPGTLGVPQQPWALNPACFLYSVPLYQVASGCAVLASVSRV